jgi:hypothetical protein
VIGDGRGGGFDENLHNPSGEIVRKLECYFHP